MENLFVAILPVITLILGGLLGLIYNYFLERFKYQKAISSKIIDRYFYIRDEICDELSDLANLQISKPIDFDQLDNKIQRLSKLYYKYYDFLPEKVLQEINCLYACLRDPDHIIYICEKNSIRIIEEYELDDYTEKVSLVSNIEGVGTQYLTMKNKDIRHSASINFQARRLLRTIHEYFTISNLSKWIVVSNKNGN